MPKRLVSVRTERPWLDIVSYGRKGPNQTLRFDPGQREQIARIVSRVPEVMVKVTGGGRSVRQVKDEIDYFGREGDLAIETDDGVALKGQGMEKFLTDDWDLELEELRSRRWVDGKPGRKAPKLVHNLMFSMPAGTPPLKVLAAARKFAQEKFALKHRYAMVLHTDQKHPHVHMLVKAMSEQGVRLNIKKAALREWRHDFARYLRELGVAANATDRVVRGETISRKSDGIYRASLRGESTHVRKRVEGVASELLKSNIIVESGKDRLLEARKEVERGWKIVADALEQGGQHDLAAQVHGFRGTLPLPATEKERLAHGLLSRMNRSQVSGIHRRDNAEARSRL